MAEVRVLGTIGSTQMNPCVHSSMVFDKGTNEFSGDNSSFRNSDGTIGQPFAKM